MVTNGRHSFHFGSPGTHFIPIPRYLRPNELIGPVWQSVSVTMHRSVLFNFYLRVCSRYGDAEPDEWQQGIRQPVHPGKVPNPLSMNQLQIHPHIYTFIDAQTGQEVHSEAIRFQIFSGNIVCPRTALCPSPVAHPPVLHQMSDGLFARFSSNEGFPWATVRGPAPTANCYTAFRASR